MLASSNFARLLQTSICVVLAALICAGCGKPKVEPAVETPAQTTSESTSTETSSLRLRSAEEAQHFLSGLWLGKAVFNQDTLQTLMTQLPEPQQQALFNEAQTFASTQMAMQLAADGMMETAIEVTPVGAESIQGQTVAQWSVTEVQGNQVVIRTTQQNENNEAITSETVYTVSADGDRIVMQANVGSALADCEPLIYLDRQIDRRVAKGPNANEMR